MLRIEIYGSTRAGGREDRMDNSQIDQFASEIATQWEQYADLYDQRMGSEGDDFHKSIIDPPFLELIGNVNGKRILDAGCGNGYFGASLVRRGAVETIAVDQSRALLELGRQRFPEPRIVFQWADLAAHWQFPERTFDLVVAHMTLQYLSDIHHFATEASRVLQPGGIAAVSIDHPAHFAIMQTLSAAGISNEKFLNRAPYLTTQYCRKRSLGGNAVLGFFHRPLFAYFMPFIESRFAVSCFRELVREISLPNGMHVHVPRVALIVFRSHY